MNYALSSCSVIIAFVKDLKEQVNVLNAMSRDDQRQIDLKDKLSELIEFNVIIKELSLKLLSLRAHIFSKCNTFKYFKICVQIFGNFRTYFHDKFLVEQLNNLQHTLNGSI